MVTARPRIAAVTRVREVVGRHYGLAQIILVVASIQSYELLRHVMVPNWTLAIGHAREIVRWERLLGIHWEAGLQATFLQIPELVKAMNVFYFVGHFVLTSVFFLWLYHFSRPVFRRWRNGFLAATAIALVIHWKFPTAPPRLADIGLQDTLQTLSNIDIGSPTSSSFSNPVAAVPSLHAGWALGVGLGLILYARPLFWKAIGAVYPIAVLLTIVVTGNHFVLDAVIGYAVMGAGFGIAWLLFERKSGATLPARRGVEQSGSSPGS
jgi:PAP2 superfamily